MLKFDKVSYVIERNYFFRRQSAEKYLQNRRNKVSASQDCTCTRCTFEITRKEDYMISVVSELEGAKKNTHLAC